MLARLDDEMPDLRLKTDGKTPLRAVPAKPKPFAMKTSLLFLAGLLMVALRLCPQVIAAGATEAWSKISNRFTDDVKVSLSPGRHLDRIAQVCKPNASSF
jgi:hypothetical protein